MCRDQNWTSETDRASERMKIEKPGLGRPLLGPVKNYSDWEKSNQLRLSEQDQTFSGGTTNSKRKQVFNPLVSANKASNIACDKCEQTFKDNYNLKEFTKSVMMKKIKILFFVNIFLSIMEFILSLYFFYAYLCPDWFSINLPLCPFSLEAEMSVCCCISYLIQSIYDRDGQA